MKRKKIAKFFRGFYIFAIVLFFVLPLGYIVLFSFNSIRSTSVFKGFTLQWYENIFSFEQTQLREAISNTIVCAVISTIVSTIIGTLGSIGLMKIKKKRRDRLLSFNNLPILNPDIVTAIGLMFVFSFLLFDNIDFENMAFIKMLIAHISFCVPYVIITVYPKIKTLDPNCLEAAQDLGSKPTEAIIRVILPQLKTAIFAAGSIAFTMSFDDYAISYFVTGAQLSNVSIFLANTGKKVNLSINAFSAIVILIITVIVVVRFIIDMRKFKKIEA